ncbi:DUF1292 domain-containing protein [Lachnobacterium bovis]|jgi:hypothetical protein|uniref:DUF1292 domain-containing protein n=1 Tax=Lachnobacterium bovis DSM 14045 TaxID=1122142 RepID=A0A1H3HN28_9FIRM|nr:DUF1292 domain-containing protein [Lachnobacterium bovis]MBQ1801871.1 DUF1292 domain-containing protein [Lachnobacterium sp.]SDY16887.1 Protein of unknown function [Lachnobacterium bovis DSM 14045]
MEKVIFTLEETDEKIEFFIQEETQLNGVKYLLVSENETGDSDAYILREIQEQDGEVTYEMVDDDNEVQALGKIFAELLDEDTNVEF